jgi:Ca2+/Na+ antiporter
MSVDGAENVRPNGGRSLRSAAGVAAIVLFVGGIVAVVVGMIMLVVAVIDVASDDGARRDSVVEIALPGDEMVDLEPGSYVVLALGEGLVGSTYNQVKGRMDPVRGPFAAPRIVVTSPDGAELELGATRVETLEDRPGTDAASLVEFTVRDSGMYTITAEPAADSTGGPVTSVILRESDGLAGFGIGDFVVGFVMVFAGGTAVLLGVLLGVASLFRRRG